MKKLLFFIMTFLTITIANGQLNPIKNLYFDCWYEMPMNCWVLSWSQPDQSLSDTLVGYNIFRNDSLYLFTTNTYITYNPCSGSPDMTYAGFTYYNSGEFWTHITAVYNSTLVQSDYNDSISNNGCGLMISVKEIIKNNEYLSPNPFSTQTTIHFNNNSKYLELKVYNIFGKIVRQYFEISGQEITINRDNLPNGIYYLQMSYQNKQITTIKVAIID